MELLLSLLLLFIMDNTEIFQAISGMQYCTRYRYNILMQNNNLSKYQKGVTYTGIKLLSNLPPTMITLNQASVRRVSPISLLIL
jgi:hypothetical protein